MGKLVQDVVVPVIQAELNRRFGPGEPIAEMIALHREFAIFSGGRTLVGIATLLNLVQEDANDRRGWLKFLNNLRRAGSDVDGQSGHDRVISAIKGNLEGKGTKPIFFTFHPLSVNKGVTVTTDAAFSFSSRKYLIISAPVGRSPDA
jgi:hypothetical protein